MLTAEWLRSRAAAPRGRAQREGLSLAGPQAMHFAADLDQPYQRRHGEADLASLVDHVNEPVQGNAVGRHRRGSREDPLAGAVHDRHDHESAGAQPDARERPRRCPGTAGGPR